MDGIYAECLKHCDKSIVALLAMCITGFLCMDSYLILCYLLCLFQLSKINVARFAVKKLLTYCISKYYVKNILLDRMSVMLSMSNQFG